MFIDRHEELNFLNNLITRKQPGPAQMVLLYGRRRVGKTELLKHWAQQSGLPYTYWAANKEPAILQRRSFIATMLNMPEDQATPFDSWPALWRWLAPTLATQPDKQILILDELSYATNADPALLSALQHAWDHHLKESRLILVICGSQINTMEAIMQHQSPLFGRFTGQWHLQSMPFSSLQEFFPSWSVAERVALYGVVGGIPAYLRWLDNDLTLVENIQQVILAPGNIFLAEPELLLYDELRDLATYQAILRAISKGHHTLKAISNYCLIGSSSLTFHLGKLQTLRLVERRLPVTLTTAQQRVSKQGRYHLSDPFFRFYFRFLLPHMRSLLSAEETTAHIKSELRAFVGLSFETLAQQWVVAQARAKVSLPFTPEAVGGHWSRRVQVDVVAVNYEQKKMLLGECKWGDSKVTRQVVRELIERKGPRVRQDLRDGDDWMFYYAVFSRAGFTEAAEAMLVAQQGLVVDLPAFNKALSP